MTRIAALGAAAAVVLAAAAPARADFIAATEVAGPTGTDTDIAVVDAATGARRALPTGVNTTADELHPGLSADGSRLVFAHVYPAGQRRIVVLDADGHTADLFDSATAAQELPGWPYLRPDGSAVLTGRAFDPASPTLSVMSTSLSAFPNGPFAHKVIDFGAGVDGSGRVVNPVASDSWYAAQVRFEDDPTALQGIGVFTQSSNGRFLVTAVRESPPPDFDLSHPALQPLTVQNVALAFERRVRIPGPPAFLASGELVYRMQPYTGADIAFPAPVNVDAAAATRPAFSADGRYLAFVRSTDVDNRLFVYDLASQVLVNPAGAELGPTLPDVAATDGDVSLAVVRVLGATSLVKGSVVQATLKQRAGVGLLVQRIVGRRQLLGRSVPRVSPVGQVALGRRGPGQVRLRFNGRVAGKRLARGRYLLTVEALGAGNAVRDMGRPFTLRVP